MNSQELVPFGKYKGQPVEVLANDRGYCDWLMSQGDFLDRYTGIKTLIVNNFKEPEDTPDHNRLQAMFLNDEFLEAFHACIVGVDKVADSFNTFTNLDESIQVGSIYEKRDGTKNKVERIFKKLNEIDCNFEHKGSDVCFSITTSFTLEGSDLWAESFYDYGFYSIEIKPNLGDDYPSIMRQIKANNREAEYGRGSHSVLIYESYTGAGTTEDNVRKMFEKSDIKTLRFSEVLEMMG